ncbi:MAG: CoA ester lyase [Actinomycetales bacterium]|nr:CoA ester lyase [Actinomycetales bacterium]
MTNVTASAVNRVAQAVSALFVPGDRPERFIKAQRTGADVIILDLEDAVSTENKAVALAEIIAALTPTADGAVLTAMVRISGTDALHELSALAAVSSLPRHGLLGIMIPKAESAEQVASVLHALPAGTPCIPLIESALGLVNVNEIARVPGVTRLAFGAVDFGLDVDATHSSIFDYARAQLVIGSAGAALAAPFDSPCLSFKDLEIVAKESLRARESGCGGKLCIHPNQVAIVHHSFIPTPGQILWAHKVVELEGGAAQLDGAMIDRPVVERAKKILAVAHAASEAASHAATEAATAMPAGAMPAGAEKTS